MFPTSFTVPITPLGSHGHVRIPPAPAPTKPPAFVKAPVPPVLSPAVVQSSTPLGSVFRTGSSHLHGLFRANIPMGTLSSTQPKIQSMILTQSQSKLQSQSQSILPSLSICCSPSLPSTLQISDITHTTSAMTSMRPKRGRRKKRPELSDDERKALRAAQNRLATRRSRERTRVRATLLRQELTKSIRKNEMLTQERDLLLRRMLTGKTTSKVNGHVKAVKKGDSRKDTINAKVKVGVENVNGVHGVKGKRKVKGNMSGMNDNNIPVGRDVSPRSSWCSSTVTPRANPMSLAVILNHDEVTPSVGTPVGRHGKRDVACDTSPVSIASAGASGVADGER